MMNSVFRFVSRLVLCVLTVALMLPAAQARASVVDGSLIKNSSSSAVYYVYHGKRYSFPNEKIYFSWYLDFKGVVTVSDTTLASYQLTGNVLYKPARQLIKIATDPRVYAVSRYGVLRWITNEATARKLYGPSWNTKVHDLSDAFYSDYLIGDPIDDGGDYIIFAESTLTDVWQNIRPVTFVQHPPSSSSSSSSSPPPSSPPATGDADLGSSGGTGTIQITAGHPRIWLTSAELPHLRSWATDANPLYKDGWKPLVAQAVADMDSGKVEAGDKGSYRGDGQYHREVYAMIFAFASLIENDPATRSKYADRAKILLMGVINEAAKGAATDQPFRDPRFSTTDRAHFYGEAFPLTVDWINDSLSASEKDKINLVFTRWADEIKHSTVTGAYAHPTPIDVLKNPVLLHFEDPAGFALRFSGNNHFLFHLRNQALMALATNNKAMLDNAVGAWFYMSDSLERTQLQGGLSPEGFEYMFTGLGSHVQAYLGLQTAGIDVNAYGQHAVLSSNPFWDEVVPAYLASFSPATAIVKGSEWLGPMYEPAVYGDADKVYPEHGTKIFGALGLYDYYMGNAKRLNADRWIELYLAPGGPSKLAYRMSNSLSASSPRNAILDFMLFDPQAPPPTDPRPALPLIQYGEGLHRLLSRTSWMNDASWFTYKLSWNRIDHQHGDGNGFEWYRKGEWLTKFWVGYGSTAASSDYNNTLTIQNDKPSGASASGGYQDIQWKHGSQFQYIGAGDPSVIAKNFTPAYDFITGDATNLYNSTSDGATDVIYANRSLFWLKPDYLVVYDRAATKTPHRFKRFWLNLENAPVISGNRATATTAKGQNLFVTTLLPVGASLSSVNQRPNDNGWDETASGERMSYRLKVEDTTNPSSVRFLHVLQGADAGAEARQATLIQGSSGTAYDGVVVNQTAVLFPVILGANFSGLTYRVPVGTGTQYVTGLLPGSSYTVATEVMDGDLEVTISAGGTHKADLGGVLTF